MEKKIDVQRVPALSEEPAPTCDSTARTVLDRRRQRILRQEAQRLRRAPATPAEKRLRKAIRRRLKGRRIRFQRAVEDVCVADFSCHRAKVAIEIDGGSHRRTGVQRRDEEKRARLEAFGWTLLRYSNLEVITKLDEIIAEIDEATKEAVRKRKTS